MATLFVLVVKMIHQRLYPKKQSIRLISTWKKTKSQERLQDIGLAEKESAHSQDY
jgi:hypothetical protein